MGNLLLPPTYAALKPILALVTETWLPEINGVAMTLSRLTEGLRDKGWRVSIVRPRRRGETGVAPSDLLTPGLPIPGYAGLRFGLPVTGSLRRAWLERRPDVVHIATEGPLGWAALKVARSLKIPVTSSFHTNFHRYCAHYRIPWLRGLVTRHLRLFHNKSAVTMVPNALLRQTLLQEGYRNVVVLGRGVDTTLFSPERRSSELRARWGARPDDPVVIHVGRIAPEKNLDTLIAAFEAMRQANPRARMVWVGNGPVLERLRRRHPHHIFTGSRLGEDLARHYASADIFLFPSLTETFGNVIAEAMASGLAVVAYDYAAAALLVQHQHSGLLAPFGDRTRFVRQAASLASMPAQVAQLGAVARTAVSDHAWTTVCSQFESYLYAARQEFGHAV